MLIALALVLIGQFGRARYAFVTIPDYAVAGFRHRLQSWPELAKYCHQVGQAGRGLTVLELESFKTQPLNLDE